MVCLDGKSFSAVKEGGPKLNLGCERVHHRPCSFVREIIATVELFFPSILPSLMIFRNLHRFQLVVCGNGFMLAECLECLTDYLLIL